MSLDRPVIELPAGRLAEYVGQYRVDGERFLTIAVDGPGLSIQFSEGGPQSRMLPENPSTFFITKNESFIFAREGGQVTSVSLRGSPGRELVATKVH